MSTLICSLFVKNNSGHKNVGTVKLETFYWPNYMMLLVRRKFTNKGRVHQCSTVKYSHVHLASVMRIRNVTLFLLKSCEVETICCEPSIEQHYWYRANSSVILRKVAKWCLLFITVFIARNYCSAAVSQYLCNNAKLFTTLLYSVVLLLMR